MALVKSNLETQLTQLFTNLATNEDGVDARQKLIEGIATAVDAYIRTALVSVTVVTTGTATNHTGTGTGTLS